jgi:endonuclease/exonuclease/phosphatase family metal-dependent hydrolase
MKKIAKLILIVTLLFTFLLTSFLIVATLNNPSRNSIETLEVENNQEKEVLVEDIVKITTFNIGYCGLDKTQDFFFDGGTNGRSSSLEKTKENLHGITNFLNEVNADIVLLQEVDRDSLRSYRVDEYALLKDSFSKYSSVFAENYNAFWVPLPITKPMGDVLGGMATFSKYNTSEANRYNLEGQESWPMKLFELDRCFVETIYKVNDKKNLYVLNIHLSAYDKDGKLRNKQSNHLKTHIENLYNQGHYVVVGGDWNQLISDVQKKDPSFIENWPDWLVEVQADFNELGFLWGVTDITTVRNLDSPYVKGVTFETIIDGFLVSPNIKIIEVSGHALDFEFSDHNPVSIEILLIK